MTHQRRLLFVALLATTVGLGACSSDNGNSIVTPQASYEVTVSNITHGQPLTPIGVVIHETGFNAWDIGQPVSVGLEQLAESGDPSMFVTESAANTNVIATMTGNGPFGPGATQSVLLTVAEDSELQLTVATMLATTNDAFTGVKNWKIGQLGVGQSQTILPSVYDAGTEANSETAATMPGPPAGGEGFNPVRDDIDGVTVHPGVVTRDDGLTGAAYILDEVHRWLGPAAKIVVTRTQ